MWDKMVQNDVTRCDVLYVAGVGGLPMPQVGVRGSSLGNFFANISYEKGIIGQFLKAPGKKGYKRFFTEIGKKRFLSKKKC